MAASSLLFQSDIYLYLWISILIYLFTYIYTFIYVSSTLFYLLSRLLFFYLFPFCGRAERLFQLIPLFCIIFINHSETLKYLSLVVFRFILHFQSVVLLTLWRCNISRFEFLFVRIFTNYKNKFISIWITVSNLNDFLGFMASLALLKPNIIHQLRTFSPIHRHYPPDLLQKRA